MATRTRPLGSYLEWHNGSIRVTVAVPRHLQAIVGATRLKRSLNTDSPANAERVKHGVVQSLKDQIAEAAKDRGARGRTQEALAWREDIASRDHEEADVLSHLLSDRAEEIELRDGETAAQEFVDVATGRATPVDLMLETYLSESGLRERSQDEARRAIRVYREWCAAAGIGQIVEAATRKIVGRFVSEHLLTKLSRKTTEKYLSFLSGYWKWLEAKGYAQDVPWTRQLTMVGKGKVRRAAADALGVGGAGGKRPYNQDEAAKLLYTRPTADTAQRTADITWIGALSGMRIDEICRLRVGDCVDGWFHVNAREMGKTDAGTRRVPIHSALVDVIARRSRNKRPDAYLIEDLPTPPPGSNRERSMPASKAYTRFRRELGIEEKGEGQRQSNVDFHSWRRWFIREAREAGASLWTLADLVGHDTKSLPGGLTMGRYPGPASASALITCIESVKPPEKGQQPGERYGLKSSLAGSEIVELP